MKEDIQELNQETAILEVIPRGLPDAGKHKDVVNFTDTAVQHQPG